MNQSAAAQALYRQGELHRLQGEFAAAEEAYREREPGRIRAAAGPGAAAAGPGRRRGRGRRDPPRGGRDHRPARSASRLLPAYVEIMLAVGDAQAARSACRRARGDRRALARARMLAAMVAHARGAVDLAEGDARAALVALRSRGAGVARARGAVRGGSRARAGGTGLRRAGRRRRGRVGARGGPRGLRTAGSGAGPRPRRLAQRSRRVARDAHGLTARELQVLRLVAAGETNKAIAAELVLSERTVDRHVSNIFAKLRRVVARRGHGVRVRAPARLSADGWKYPRRRAAEVGCFRRCAASRPPASPALTRGRHAPTGDAREQLLSGIAVTERRLTLAGVSTAVLEGGDGPPMVLLHGPGEFAAKWMRVIPELVKTHRVVAPDLPGHGASGVDGGHLDGDRMARLARRADRAHLPVAAGAGGPRARRGHRGPLRHRPGRPAQRARARGHAGPEPLSARAEVRAHPGRLPGATDRRARTTASCASARSIWTACASRWASAGSRSSPTTSSLPARRAPRSSGACCASSDCRGSRRPSSHGSPFPRP